MLTVIGFRAVTSSEAIAQSLSTKPIKTIDPFGPGRSTDIIARSIADPLIKQLRQPVIAENKAGGG